MLEAIIRRLKRLNCNKRGVSNVLVVMLSLILITVIVANVVLWNYQMNQLDIERMHESVSITNADRITRSQWFTAQKEFSITTGTNVSGSHAATTSIDSSYETFREEPPSVCSYPSSYNLLGGTRYVSGLLTDLQSNDSVYMSFRNVDEDFVDQQSDVDGVQDIGTHGNFDSLKAGPDGNFDTLTEGATYNQVTFVSAGAGSGTTANPTPSYPTELQAGDLILLQVTVRDTTNTPTTPTGFTLLYGPDSTGTGRQWIYYKFADGSESGTLTITIGGTSCKIARMYAFRNVAPSNFIESGGFASGLTATISPPPVTTTGVSELAVAFVFVNDDNAVGSFAGETGGDWVEAVAEFTTTAGFDGCVQLQTATMANAGTISGGSYTMSAADPWGVRVFALKPKPNHQLDIEVQWVNINYEQQNEHLCIYAGALSSEGLHVDVWTGSSWTTVIAGLSPGWNNVSLSSYLTSSTFTIRFKGAVETGDTSQSSWQIDCALLRLGNNYIQVEFTGTLEARNLTRLIWAVDCSFTTDLVNATFQLYDYQAGEYSTGGDGYMTATIGTSDVTLNQTITTNPTRFIDANGNWKMKITGTKATATPFILKVDWIELEATLSNIYRLEISNSFTIDLSTYPLNYLYGVEIMVRYNVSEAAERWFIKAYDWASESFSDAGFNNTSGNMPTLGEWNNYAVSINENWTRYIGSDGTIRILFCDEGVGENQTLVHVDFIGVRVILNGIRLDIKNSGAVTAHIVSVWIINATHHMRYNADFFINPGEAAVYIRVDIPPPAGNFTVKVVTERGNMDYF
jgi:hypothetical protein